MKLKSLLFGSAAVLAAGTGALAADLPVVEPVDYVRICDAFGARFYYIPGTDTCLRVGGYVRAESHYVDGDVGVLYSTANSQVNNWTTRARGQILLDARTQTDYGLVRAYVAIEMTVGPGATSTQTTATTLGTSNYDGSNPNLAAAYIQVSNDWGTYTAGHTGSFFDFWGGNSYGTRLGLETGTGEATLFAWTFAGGNGFSFTVSAEDPASIGRRRNGDDDYEGQEAPDGVANIRVDQGWGSAQVMGAVRHINDVNGDGIGFAVGAGLSINLPGGWVFSSQGGYSEGAIAYVSGDPGKFGDFDGPTGDDQNESWAVRAGLKGPLMNNITGWIEGGFTHVVEDPGNNDEYDWWAIIAGAAWEPVPGLTMGPEVAFHSYDITNVNGNGANPVDIRTDYDVWGFMWRVQRSF
ncbi:MAG: porin [Propylenella sp.]